MTPQRLNLLRQLIAHQTEDAQEMLATRELIKLLRAKERIELREFLTAFKKSEHADKAQEWLNTHNLNLKDLGLNTKRFGTINTLIWL